MDSVVSAPVEATDGDPHARADGAADALAALQLVLGTGDATLPALPLVVRAISILLIAALTWVALRAVSAIGDTGLASARGRWPARG